MMKEERGQAIIIMAFALIVVAAFAGLAIDGGRAYSTRRRVQNASDASAMAGTRILAQEISECTGIDSLDLDNLIGQAIIDIARDNGVDQADADNVTFEAWYVDATETRLHEVAFGLGVAEGATGVEVSLAQREDTTFMRVVGQPTLTASAGATALTGPVIQFGGGLLPIAVPLEVVVQLDVDEEFYVQDFDGAICREDDDLCIRPGDDPSDPNAQRGWLNFNYIYNANTTAPNHAYNRTFSVAANAGGCGPTDGASYDDGAKGWASGDCPYVYPIFAGTENNLDNDFIQGKTGAVTSALIEIERNYIGELVYLPIFDYVYESEILTDNGLPDPQNPPNGSINNSNPWPGGANDHLYHIVGIVAVELTGARTSGHELEGLFKDAVIGDGQIRPGEGYGNHTAACDEHQVIGIQLWR